MVPYTTAEYETFIESIGYLDTVDQQSVLDAFEFARLAHGDQHRQSGEPFFTHPVTVATYLTEYHLDAATIQAALLHDIAEDTVVSIEEIEARFGPDVARLVDGVTKLKEVTRGVAATGHQSRDDLRHATLGKLFQAMTNDVRTVIIKLFDRLHNMRTIQAMPPHKQLEKAHETLAVFAPLANRLGMWRVKSELESLSLEIVDPEAFEEITDALAHLGQDQQEQMAAICAEVRDCLTKAGINVLNVRAAPENVYTIYQDLRSKNKSFSEIDPTMRVVVLLEDAITCYTALGYIHGYWRAVPGRFDDYISVRRDNLYQSLHTTVIHRGGAQLKVRLRTEEMEQVAQYGVLTQWLYPESSQWSQELASRLGTFMGTVNDNIGDAEPHDMVEGVRGVVEDVLQDQMRIYTPKGEFKELPRGATAIDFAYSIHTKLGDETEQAYVNGALYPLNRPLTDGDLVRIVRKNRSQPQRAWLDEDLGYIATARARSHARRWFRRLSRARAISEGQQLLERELDMLGMSAYPHETIAASFSLPSVDELYYQLGRAELLPLTLSTQIMTDTWDTARTLPLDNVVSDTMGNKFVITNADRRELKLCSSCGPRPRDTIIGYVRKDGGVTVHRDDCHLLKAQSQRLDRAPRRLKLEWGKSGGRQARRFRVHIDVFDRPNLLYEIAKLIGGESINIPEICTVRDERDDEPRIELSLECTSPRQMVRVLHQTQGLVNVKSVRVIPDSERPPLPPSSYRPE